MVINQENQKCSLTLVISGNDKKHVQVEFYSRTVIKEGIGSETVKSGDDVRLKCEAIVDSRLKIGSKTLWLKDEQPLDVTNPRISVGKDVVVIADTEKSDEGRYECQVQTEYDKQVSSGLLTVLNEPPSIISIPNNIRYKLHTTL